MLKDVKTKNRHGKAIQYNGENIQEIADTFDLDFKELKSKSTLNGATYPDYIISEKGEEEWNEVLIGDYVYKDKKYNFVTIIPYFDFEEYWEIDNLTN